MIHAIIARTGNHSLTGDRVIPDVFAVYLLARYRVGRVLPSVLGLRQGERPELDACREPSYVFMEVGGKLRLIEDLSPRRFDLLLLQWQKSTHSLH
jgi:hypothetical protein